MLPQARAMRGQAPLQRSDPSSQPVCKVSASTRLLLVPLFASAYLAASLDLHSVGYNAVCIARSHAHTDIQGIEDNHHILSSLPIQFLPNGGITVMQGFPPDSFEYILLDAPCSALGLRPRLSHHTTLLALMQVFPLCHCLA